jgi:hypothetical protein
MLRTVAVAVVRLVHRRTAAGGYSKPNYPPAGNFGGGRGTPPPSGFGGGRGAPSPSNLPYSNNSSGSNNGGSGGGGGRRWNTSDGNRPLCQLCNTLGHIAAHCWKRFDKDFLGVGNDGANLERQVSMVTHGNHHQAAYTPSYPVDPVWYMDTDATDHLTGELDKLGVKEPYNGKDHVHTANGQGMRISHIGQSTLSTNTATPLCLKDILVCPQVTKNLLCAHKLALDNNVFVEIHPFDLFVKDRDTKEIILSGRTWCTLSSWWPRANSQIGFHQHPSVFIQLALSSRTSSVSSGRACSSSPCPAY